MCYMSVNVLRAWEYVARSEKNKITLMRQHSILFIQTFLQVKLCLGTGEDRQSEVLHLRKMPLENTVSADFNASKLDSFGEWVRTGH